MRIVSLLALAVGLCWAAPVAAQSESAKLEILLTSVLPQGGPAVVTTNLLADRNTRELLTHGFTAGLHFRLEMWRKTGVFDDLDGRTEWDVLVSYDPTKQVYSVIRRQSNRLLENFGTFPTAEAAEAQIGQPFRVSLAPRRSGRYYYNLIVEVQTLTENDLSALQQWWLRGTTGRSNPLSLMGRGVAKLLSRVLGGDKRHLEQQSGQFTVP